MAKQTFTTGQVLTSAQMTALQLNDYNQTVSAKVASYVLVAADAGTRITMSNAGATTITVNTSLFAAGDTLFITNIGAGACTITAGTATVSTASSLVLAQYDSGRLYFTSTGVAIWEKYQGAAASSGSLTLLSTTTLSGASTTISSINQTYKKLEILVYGCTNATVDGNFTLKPNNASLAAFQFRNAATTVNAYDNSVIYLNTDNQQLARANANNFFRITIDNYASAATLKSFNMVGVFMSGGTAVYTGAWANGGIATLTAISSLVFANVGGSHTAGTVEIYGVN